MSRGTYYTNRLLDLERPDLLSRVRKLEVLVLLVDERLRQLELEIGRLRRGSPMKACEANKMERVCLYVC